MTRSVSMSGVTKSYPAVEGEAGTPILKNLSLEVENGEAVAIVGPSGSGKSTILNLISGLDLPDSGKIMIDGEDLGALGADQLASLRQHKIGFIFQDHHLLPQCTALENVLIPTLIDKDRTRRTHAVERAEKWLDRVGLSHRLNHRPSMLSGGESQRVAVVRALINNPLIILADEPTGSLDPHSADGLGDLLIDLNRNEGQTLIIVTHSESLAERIGRVRTLVDGALVAPESVNSSSTGSTTSGSSISGPSNSGAS